MSGVVVVLLVLTAAIGFAFDPRFADSSLFWILLATPLVAAGAFSTWQLRRQGALPRLLALRKGDLTLGALVAALLLAATWLGRTNFAALGTPRQFWLFHVYLQLGDPDRIQASVGMTCLLFAIILAEELIFRGYVQEVFESRFGERRGWILAAFAYALVMTPTLWTLRAENVGLNPLLFLTALLAGLSLGFLRHVSGRLPPVIVAQGVFTYFAVLQFRLPGL